MADEIKTETELEQKKDSVETKSEQTNKETSTEQRNEVDVEKVKNDALADFLNSLGVEDTEKLKGIVTKAKEDEEANKTELEKKNDALTETLKQLAEEREARIISDARYEALKLGARPEMVDDLVVVAKSKVTKDKDISTVVAEIKDSESGKFYFVSDEEEEQKTKEDDKNVTRKRVQTKQTSKTKNDSDDSKDDTFASRYFANKRKRESHFFK